MTVFLMEVVTRNNKDNVHAGAKGFIHTFLPLLQKESIYTTNGSHYLYNSQVTPNRTDIQRHVNQYQQSIEPETNVFSIHYTLPFDSRDWDIFKRKPFIVVIQKGVCR